MSADERVVLERLRMVRVAKDVFLSDWYTGSCATLRFDDESCRVLGEIAEESRDERDRLFELFERWARGLEPVETASEKARDVERVARRNFLLHMIDIKDASADAVERAALLAPAPLKEEMMRLAALDVEHANRLRGVLVGEVQEAWATRSGRAV